VLIYNDKQWKSFFEAIGRPEMMSDPRYATQSSRASNIAEIYAALSELMKTRRTAEWTALFEKADIPVARMNSIEDLVADPHLAASGFFETEQHPSEGTLRVMRTPTTWSDTQPGPRRPPPRLGEHSQEILRDAGYSDAQIGEMARAGVTLLAG
jgi:crotonobetainyl-CoA:carnitine CoA-transferase CaiB-like acyl-CoA transferase